MHFNVYDFATQTQLINVYLSLAPGLSTSRVATAAVPEPETWAMMIGGFGLIGGTLRRRNKIATTVRFA